MIDSAKSTTQSWSFFWYMAAGNMQIQWIRASPAVGAPQDNRRAKNSTSWGAKHLRRMKREDGFPAVGAPQDSRQAKSEWVGQKKWYMEEYDWLLLPPAPPAAPQRVGCGMGSPAPFWGLGGMAGPFFAIFSSPAEEKAPGGGTRGGGWRCSNHTPVRTCTLPKLERYWLPTFWQCLVWAIQVIRRFINSWILSSTKDNLEQSPIFLLTIVTASRQSDSIPIGSQ